MTPYSFRVLSVIGAGAWGTALAHLLATKGFSIRLWAHEPEVADIIQRTRENSWYLPEVVLPNSIQATISLPDCVQGTDVILLAVPSHAMANMVKQLHLLLNEPLPIIIATKGIEEGTLQLMSQVVEGHLPAVWHPFITILSGPSFASEVSRWKPTTILLAGRDFNLVNGLQQAFITPQFRVYAGRDIIGAQLGGALKNVMAIGAGVVDGLDLGSNARAALITRGLAEMIRLGRAMGADVATFYGLSGLGDLVLTCTGTLSRNYQIGMQLAKGANMTTLRSTTRTVAEGVPTSRAAMELAERYHVDMPIVRGVFQMIFEGRNPRHIVTDLMSRLAKGETDGLFSASTATFGPRAHS
ncbi:MAG TPA: NAD(P)H-dependent glycerol-3-phosphate dehydrogenase [Nitrospirales bacterium]|nr:glycerol-3-phosphate dehydrogenase [Nitrospiraceae bacterium]HNP29977.1 NAD(P)H-dependent glycerol-3-phosphate dehydrogenase [Nitrospirales bacterium]